MIRDSHLVLKGLGSKESWPKGHPYNVLCGPEHTPLAWIKLRQRRDFWSGMHYPFLRAIGAKSWNPGWTNAASPPGRRAHWLKAGSDYHGMRRYV